MAADLWLQSSIALAREVLSRAQEALAETDEAPDPWLPELEAGLAGLTSRTGRPAAPDELLADCNKERLLVVGDFATDRAPKELAGRILAATPDAALVIGTLPSSLSAAMGSFVLGQLTTTRLYTEQDLSDQCPRAAWRSFAGLLKTAVRLKRPILLPDPGDGPLVVRQEKLVSALVDLARERPVVALVGELRLADAALSQLPSSLRRATRRVLLDAPNAFFEAVQSGGDGTGTGRLTEDTWYQQSQPPLCRLLGHVHWLETGEESLDGPTLVRQFPRYAAAIRETLGLPPYPPQPIEVFAPGDPRYLPAVARTGVYTAEQMQHLAQQVALNQSRFLPEADIAYLGTPVRSHAAEEAGHYVRARLGGPGVGRSSEDRFWSIAVHEIAGYLGSKVVVSRRKPPRLTPGITPETFDSEARAHLYGYQMGERIWGRLKVDDTLRGLVRDIFLQDLVEPGAAKDLYFRSLNCVAARQRV